MIAARESDAQLLAWQLKEEAWAEVEHLPLAEALRERARLCAVTAQRTDLGLVTVDLRSRPTE